MAAFAPRVAAQQTPHRQITSRPSSVGLQRTQRIHGARGLEPAGRSQPRAQKKTIGPNASHQKPLQACLLRGNLSAHRRLGALEAAAIKAANSADATSPSFSEAALENSTRGNGERNLTTHMPADRCPAWRAATRIRLFSKFRVTERLACFLGTTKPSQRPSRGPSSTDLADLHCSAVDNSVPDALAVPVSTAVALGCHACGAWASKCTAKCGDLARQGSLSTLEKSDARVMEAITATAIRTGRDGPHAHRAWLQTARRLRPLARRALITARPPRVFMRTRKPWVRARRVFEG